MIKTFGWRYFQDRNYNYFVKNGTVTERKTNPYNILIASALFIAIIALGQIVVEYQQYGLLLPN